MSRALFDSIEFRTEARGLIYICWNEELVHKVQTVSMANVPTSSRLFEGNEPLDPPPLPLFESKFVTFRLAGRLA